MKALSVRQPWATLIAAGEKTVEWRSWATQYRGQLLVCASKRSFRFFDPETQEKRVLPGGIAICTVELVDCRPLRFTDRGAACLDEMPNPVGFAWILRDAQPIEPVPVVGKLHLFDPPKFQLKPLLSDIYDRLLSLA